MPLSLRLDPQLEARLEEHCRRTGLSKSRLISLGLSAFLEAHPALTLHDLGEDLFPVPGTGKGNRSETRGRRYREHVRAKRARR